MGEEKPEEKKAEEEAKKPVEEKVESKEEKKTEDKSGGEKDGKGEVKEEGKEAPPPPPPPPEEFEYRVFMHCEGCARKVKRSLRGFPGVEDVITDCKSHKVLVKGKTADPLKVLERIQRKSHRKVELLTPLPEPPAEDPKKAEEEKPKEEEKKEEPQVIIVILRVHMHCEACAQGIKKRILRMKGVQAADPDLKSSQVVVKGVFDPAMLVEYVYKKTGKHAVVVKQEVEQKEGGEKAKEGEEKKEGGGEEKKGEGEEEQQQQQKEGAEEKMEGGAVETKVEVRKNEYLYFYPRYPTEHVYAPQIFSDENPNACSVM